MKNHQEIVKKILDSKAVDFAAIGRAVAEIGPALAMSEEPWDGFCGTMRYFVHIYRNPFPVPIPDPIFEEQ